MPSRFHPQGCCCYLPSRFCPQGFYLPLRFCSRLLSLFTFEVSPSRLLSLFTFEVFPSRFYICLRGFALKVVVVIYLRGFALKVFIYLRGFALKVVRSLPLGFRPQGCYNYLPSRFRPQGCFIFAFEVSPSKLFLFLRLRPLCLLGIYRACWCVDSLSDMACPCPLLIYILFIL